MNTGTVGIRASPGDHHDAPRSRTSLLDSNSSSMVVPASLNSGISRSSLQAPPKAPQRTATKLHPIALTAGWGTVCGPLPSPHQSWNHPLVYPTGPTL